MVFGWVSDLLDKFGRALIPLRKLDTAPVVHMLKHPMQTKKLLDKKQAAIILLGEDHDIDIVAGINYSNTILNPSLGKNGMGWITKHTSTWTLKRRNTAYICHPKIPFALEVDEKAFHSTSQISPERRATLGLPEDMEQLLPESLGALAVSKWQSGFDEVSGKWTLVLFGMGIGGFIMTIVIFLFMILISVFSRK